MTWLRVDGKLPSHFKTRALADLLKIRRREAVGLLVVFWAHVADNHPDGEVTELDWVIVAHLAEFPLTRIRAIRESLVEAGFIDRGRGRLTCHDWEEWHGVLITRRIKDAARKAKQRKESRRQAEEEHRRAVARDDGPQDNGENLPDSPRDVQTVRNGTKRNGTKPTEELLPGLAAPAGPKAPNWVALVHAELIQVGDCQYGQIGKRLAVLHKTHGALLPAAAGAYRRKVLDGGPDQSRYIRGSVVNDFAKQAGVFVEMVRPGSGVNAQGDPVL